MAKFIVSDLQMMSNPDLWPGDILPLKRKVEGKFPFELGLLLPIGENKCKVYLVNMYDLPKPIEEIPTLEYNTFQEILDAGWEID